MTKNQLKVFYIDDEPALCENFADAFASSVVLIKTFTDPDAAINEAIQDPPDVVFVDYRFPKISGDEVASRMPAQASKYLVTGDFNVKSTYPFKQKLLKPTDNQEIEALLIAHQMELGIRK